MQKRNERPVASSTLLLFNQGLAKRERDINTLPRFNAALPL